jgi:FkbM family methyltransferase
VWKAGDWSKALARRVLPSGIQGYLRAYYLTRKVLTDDGFVEPEMAALNKIVSAGQVVLDIGANVGFYTKLLSILVGASGRVYSFEPIAANFRILERVVKDGRLANVQTFLAAVDRQSGEQDMVIPDRRDFTGFYQARLAGNDDAGERQHVRVVSLDQMHADGTIPLVDFIKCDAEGSELGVLQGSVELLKKSHPSLLLEVQRKKGPEVFALLYNLGYRSFRLDKGFLEVAEFDPKFWNYFFMNQRRLSQLGGGDAQSGSTETK